MKATNRNKTVQASCGCALLFTLMAMLAVNARGQMHWVGSWAASQQLPEPQNALPPAELTDATLRQIVHLSLGGTELRVRISNRFGVAPLVFSAVHIAEPVSTDSPTIVTGTDKALTFSGSPEATVPAGADYISDPIAFPAAPLSSLAITLYIKTPPQRQTGHPGSRATSYVAHGDLLGAADLPDATKVEHWYFIAGVDVEAPERDASVAILGDSITDGHGATLNENNRWPDVLAERLHASPKTRTLAVLNLGTGGNRLLLDGLGPNALARLGPDALHGAAVRYLIMLEGVNDLGMRARQGHVSPTQHAAMVHQIIAAYEQIITRAQAHGIEVIGGTIMPFSGSQFYRPGPDTEADRQKINQWIRGAGTPGHFDAVIDFDKRMRDPDHPDRLAPGFDSGDHLHPSPAGYAAMANAVPLSLFSAAPKGCCQGRE
jgi:lysophospholipase L1-like esterase